MAPIFLVNIGQLVTLRSGAHGPRRGKDLRELGIIQGGAVVCLGGKIVAVGTTRDALHDSWVKKNRTNLVEIDCAGKVVLPGFVDSHTHPVFISPRLVDFEKRISGSSYEEIAAAGGGIRSSVDAVRRAGKMQLADHVLGALKELSASGDQNRISRMAWHCGSHILRCTRCAQRIHRPPPGVRGARL
jgi:imidazolonepropionase